MKSFNEWCEANEQFGTPTGKVYIVIGNNGESDTIMAVCHSPQKAEQIKEEMERHSHAYNWHAEDPQFRTGKPPAGLEDKNNINYHLKV